MANFLQLTLTKETFIKFFFFFFRVGGELVENVNDEACSSFPFYLLLPGVAHHIRCITSITSNWSVKRKVEGQKTGD